MSSVHDITAGIDLTTVTLEQVEADPTRCPDPTAADRITEAIERARRDGDSLGGVVTCVAAGCPPGWGDPVFDKLEADLARAVMSLPATKGFEVGSGFGATLMTGRQHNDPFVPGGGRPATHDHEQLRGDPGGNLQRRGHRPASRFQADRDDRLATGHGEPSGRGRHLGGQGAP